MRKPKTSDKSTAELLKAAAIKLFSKYGYEGTTVRDIAKLAGFTAGQINVNFGSKEQLFETIAKDIYGMTCQEFDPISAEYVYLKQNGQLTEEKVWELIEKIIDTQIDFCMNTDNIDLVQMSNVHLFNENIKSSAMLAQMTIGKIEDMLAKLFQEVFRNKRYLHARTVSRMVNGAIVSLAEHPDLLYTEVLQSEHMPDSQAWMSEYVKSFVMNSIHSEALNEE